MREDMHKVIVERPRHGSRMSNWKTGLRYHAGRIAEAVEDAEGFDDGAVRRRHRYSDKTLNEHLRPLERYLHSQVNRPWDKVYSEIRQGIDTRSAIGLHVMQHLEDFVSVRTYIEDGKVYAHERWSRNPQVVSGLYVHPVTGLLRFAPQRRRNGWRAVWDREDELNFVAMSETLEYEKIEGLWFRMEYHFNDLEANPQQEVRSLVLKRQCDAKTSRRIEAGVYGAVVNKGWFYRVTLPRWALRRR
jgi:hypothetical protein